MSLTIGSNIASLSAQRRLADASSQLSTVYERLSSGQRINSASDDAAGLAIAESLRSDTRVLNQGIRNLNDGISLLTIADSSLESLTSIIVRIEELATQAANGTLGTMQREALNMEAQELSKEFLRISRSTSFNGISLFNGSVQNVNLQAGAGANSTISTGVGGVIGTGTFGSAISITSGSQTYTAFDSGDLNGDGILDIVWARDSELQYALGTGGGNFAATKTIVSGVPTYNDLTLKDVNGDGILDLASAGTSGGSGFANIRLGVGDGSFGVAQSYASATGGSRAIAVGDVNGDGLMDIVTADNNVAVSATVRLGTGQGTFDSATSYIVTGSSNYEVQLADFNGDGKLDLLTIEGNHTKVRIGTGSGTFGSAVSVTSGSTTFTSASIGDLNGDGKLDVVSGNDSGSVAISLGSGGGTFTQTQTYSMHTTSTAKVELGDLNGDGHLDIISGGTSGAAGTIVTRLGTGTATFGASASFSTGTGVTTLGLSDFNADGVLDISTGYSAGIPFLELRFSNTQYGVGALLPFDLTSLAEARQTIPVLARKREQLALQRGTIGAFESRVGFAVNVLQATAENYRTAESRIRDADIAQESSKLVSLQILQQAASAVLGQANQQPSLAIKLLSSE